MIIFLDCDGVINQLQSNFYIDKKCIKYLADITIYFDAKIILTSTWRLGFLNDYNRCTPQIKDLRNNLREYNIDIQGRTLKLNSRYDEIKDYISKHNDDYIILDDDENEFEGVIDDRLYFVNYKTGLTKKDVKIIKKRYL